jgi:hypothetical protein
LEWGRGRRLAAQYPGDGSASVQECFAHRPLDGQGSALTELRPAGGGLSLPRDELEQLAAELKRLCGSVGSLKEGVIAKQLAVPELRTAEA